MDDASRLLMAGGVRATGCVLKLLPASGSVSGGALNFWPAGARGRDVPVNMIPDPSSGPSRSLIPYVSRASAMSLIGRGGHPAHWKRGPFWLVSILLGVGATEFWTVTMLPGGSPVLVRRHHAGVFVVGAQRTGSAVGGLLRDARLCARENAACDKTSHSLRGRTAVAGGSSLDRVVVGCRRRLLQCVSVVENWLSPGRGVVA